MTVTEVADGLYGSSSRVGVEPYRLGGDLEKDRERRPKGETPRRIGLLCGEVRRSFGDLDLDRDRYLPRCPEDLRR